MNITRIALVRHGETDWNRQGRLQGWTDIPLNATGRDQAARLALALATVHLSAIVASPLARARDTAQAVADQRGLPLHLDARLRERNLGQLQGLTRDEVRQRHPTLAQHLDERRTDYQPPEGESFAQLQARALAALADVLAGHAGGTVLVVAHGGVLDAIHRHLCHTPPDAPRTVALPNAALNWLRHDGQAWHIEHMGHTAHLHGLDAHATDIGA